MKHKGLFISLVAIFSVIIFLGIFLLSWFKFDKYPDFKNFKQEFAIEGLDEGATPQGLGTYYANYDTGEVDEKGNAVQAKQQYFLMSAYMKDGSPSRIYVTGYDTGYVGYVTMKNTDGSPHLGHVGGIATNGATLWVTYNDSILVAKASEEYSKDNILVEIIDKAAKNIARADGEEELSITFTTSFKANCNAAFLYYCDDSRYTGDTYDRLYVGEFYRKGNYETAQAHRLKTPAGYQNTALMYEYRVDTSSQNPYGLERLVTKATDVITGENNVPKIQKIYSIPERIQGVAFSGRTGYSTNDGVLVLSQSYGLSNSHLLCFDWKLINETANRSTYKEASGSDFVYDGVYKTFGSQTQPYIDNSINVYFVDKGNENMFKRDYSLPSMTEGMCVATKSGPQGSAVARIYVLFENASKKYNLFTREKIKNVYSFIPNVK